MILGAGAFSRQIAELIEDSNRHATRWRLRGFLDDDATLIGRTVFGYPVLGPLEMAGTLDAAQMVIGIANVRRPGARRVIAARLGLPPARYAALIHSSASLSSRAEIGNGSVLLHNVVVSHGVALAAHVLVSAACIISHDTRVDDGVTFAAGVIVNGGCKIGAGSYLGSACVIRECVTIGEGSVVGMGAVVTRDVPPGATVFGSPAKERIEAMGRA